MTRSTNSHKPLSWLIMMLALTPSLTGAIPDAHAQHAAERPVVLSSILPLQLLVQAVSGDRVESRLLLKGNQNPHQFTLKPSDMRQLNRADLIFRISPKLENFQIPSPRQRKVVDLIQVLPEAWQQELHPWLDPVLGLTMAEHIAKRLASMDPANARHYHQRLEQLRTQLKALDQELARQLTPLNQVGFAVAHDAFGAVRERYGLRQTLVLSYSPEIAPKPQALRQLQQLIGSGQVRCLITDPHSGRGLLRMLARYEVPQAMLEPLGSTSEAMFSYPDFLRQTLGPLVNCLERGSR